MIFSAVDLFEGVSDSDMRNRNQLLLVSTCHIHWDPDYSDVKLIQTMMLMNELKNITEMALVTSPICRSPGTDADQLEPWSRDVPLILCGDFNSLPDSGNVSRCIVTA